jgi:hypothetical protein
MNRGDAYAVVSTELNALRRRPFDELVALVGVDLPDRAVPLGTEQVTLRVWLRWADDEHNAVRIYAAAGGPNWWRMDRVDESSWFAPPRKKASPSPLLLRERCRIRAAASSIGPASSRCGCPGMGPPGCRVPEFFSRRNDARTF